MPKNTLPTLSGIDIAAPGGIDALLAWHRSAFGDARMEGDETDGAGDSTADANGASDHGATFTQADLDRILGQRLAREREQAAERYADYDQLKTKASELDEILEAAQTDQERAIFTAREEAAAAARAEKDAEYATRDKARTVEMINAHLELAKRSGRIDVERFGPALEAIDRNHYVTADGGIDLDKLATVVDSMAPVKPAKSETRWPNTGQGHQGNAAVKAGVDAGKELFAARRGGKKSG